MVVSPELRVLVQEFAKFRSDRRTPRARIPPELWQSASTLASRLSVNSVAKACQLSPDRLRDQMKSFASPAKPKAQVVRVVPVRMSEGLTSLSPSLTRLTLRQDGREMCIETSDSSTVGECIRSFWAVIR